MRLVKTDRGLLMYILFSLITFGIYPFFFVHGLAEDVNEMCRDDGKTTTGVLMFILLSFITCGIYGIYWWYAVSERIGQAAARRGLINVNFSGATYLLWTIIGSFVCGIGSFVAIHKLCSAANQVGMQHNQMVMANFNQPRV